MATSTRSSSARTSSISDAVLGLLLVLAGAFLLAGTYLAIIPSLTALLGLLGVAGLVGIAGALLGRTSAGFFSEIVAAALLVAFVVVGVRYPDTPPSTLLLLSALALVAIGVVRLASATEYPKARAVFLIGGAGSLGLAVAVLSGAVPATLASLSIVWGLQLCVDGACALAIGRLESGS